MGYKHGPQPMPMRPQPPAPKDTRDGRVPEQFRYRDGRILIWLFCLAMIGVVVALARSASAGEIPCPDPVVPHDDAQEYKTHRGARVYTIRWQAPDADPGELLSCSIQIGTVALITEPTPTSLACYEEDVSGLEGREIATRWCTTDAGDTDRPSTRVKLPVPGPKLF